MKTRQKSENSIIPSGRGNPSSTRILRNTRGGKGVPVKEAVRQLVLPFVTAENSPKGDSASRFPDDQSSVKKRKEPKAKGKNKKVGLTLMQEVVSNLPEAFENVARNHGAPGPDRQTIEEVRKNFSKVLKEVVSALESGTYFPGDIRRVWIPKSGGGQRGLGIPNVVTRMVQEAVRMVIEPIFEPTFHQSSHGFRPNRSCHTAIAQAKKYVEEGYEWVVDMDLEKFFDRVNHQRLMACLSRRIKDKPLLVLIGRMLKARVVMPDGVKVSTDEGVPQGGPLSPLLSNIVLSELDEELERRGLRFVRYADDGNIYVKSQRAGQRVMASIERFIRKRLRLRINAEKSAVARPVDRHFLGFRIYRGKEGVGVMLSRRSEERLKERIKELTPRRRGASLLTMISSLNQYLKGWFGFFQICAKAVRRDVRNADSHIRRRLRAILLKHWKRKKTIARRLIQLGVPKRLGWGKVYEDRKGLWALSHSSAVEQGLRNAYFSERGLVSLRELFENTWEKVNVPVQLRLFQDTARS